MPNKITLSRVLSDSVAAIVGSWKFVIIQSIILIGWITYNVYSFNKFDAYPFIFLNLILSFQAAYTAPIIMMSNNRKEEIDRKRNIDLHRLETEDNKILKDLMMHLDKHFDIVNELLIAIENK